MADANGKPAPDDDVSHFSLMYSLIELNSFKNVLEFSHKSMVKHRYLYQGKEYLFEMYQSIKLVLQSISISFYELLYMVHCIHITTITYL